MRVEYLAMMAWICDERTKFSITFQIPIIPSLLCFLSFFLTFSVFSLLSEFFIFLSCCGLCMGWLYGLVWFGFFLPKVGLDTTGSFFQQILGEVWLDKGGCILGDGHVFLLILFSLTTFFYELDWTVIVAVVTSHCYEFLFSPSYLPCVIFFFGVPSHPVSEFFLSVLTGKIIICLADQGS